MVKKIVKADHWDGKSRPGNTAYDEGYNRIFGKKEIDELKESLDESIRAKKERDPLKNFSKDLKESINKRTYKKEKDHGTDISYENEK